MDRRILSVILLISASSVWAAPGLSRKALGAGGATDRPAPRWALGREHRLADLGRLPTPADVARLRAAGARVVSLVPMTGLIVTVADGTRAADLDVTVLRRLEPAEKISPLLRQPAARGSEIEPGWFVVEFHPDVNPAVARAIAVQNGWLLRDNPNLTPGQLLVSGAESDLESLAAWDEVNYIFPASRSLVAGEPVYVCAGADTQSGTLGQSIPLIGDGWDGPGLGSATLGYAFSNRTSQLTPDQVTNAIVNAFAEWSKYVQVDFQATANTLAPETIAILFATGAHGDPYPFGPAGTILAHTFYPAPPNPEPLAGDMHFNDANPWGIGNSVDLFSVALHETGHALGLGHSDLPSAVMYPYYKMVTGLTPEDIAAAQMLYASRGAAAAQPPASAGTTGATATSGTTGAPGTTGSTSGAGNGSPTGGSGGTGTTGTGTSGNGGGNKGSGGKDTAPPVLAIVSPGSSTVSTSNATIVLQGVATDNVGVASVTWSTSTGFSGAASGTSHWTTAPIPLYVGMNVINVVASDAAGNTSWRTAMVTRY